MRVLRTIAALAVGIIALGSSFLWWAGRPPKRPHNFPSNAIYIETGVVPFKIRSTPGTWLGCWYDPTDQFDHCRLTDENGRLKFEDVFLPYEGQGPIPQAALVFDTHRTGTLWTGSYEKGIRVPVIYLADGQILLPKAVFEEAKRDVHSFVR
jgi:hypothetical protein